MTDLRTQLEQEVGRARFSPGGYERTLARVRRRERSRRAIAGALALALAAGGLAGAWVALHPKNPPSQPSPLKLAPNTQAVVGGGSVWFLSCDRCSDAEVTAARARGRLLRVDPLTRRLVATIPIANPGDMAIGYEAVWITNFAANTVTKVDIETNRIATTIPLPPLEVAPGDHDFLPLYVAVGEGAVWVETARGAVARIDPRTDQVVYAPVVSRGGDILGDLAAGEGAIWVDEGVEGVRRLDPRSGAFIARVPPYQDGLDLLSAQFFAPGGGFVWATGSWARWSDEQGDLVATDEWVLLRIDPATNGMVPVADLRGGGWPVAFGGGAVWVVSGSTGSMVFRFDPARGRITATLDLPAGDILVPADDGGTPWLVGRDGTLTRIDTLLGEAPSVSPKPVTAFIPRTYREGDSIVMPVTFPDGSTAEVLYPQEVDLAGMGLQPDGSYLWLDYPPPRYPLSFYHGDPNPSLFAGDAPVATYQSNSGPVELWPASSGASDSGDPYWLIFHFGAWTVLAPVPDTEAATEVARALDGKETSDGFVVIDAKPPIGLSDEPGEGGGAFVVSMGDADPRPYHVSDLSQLVILRGWPEGCRNDPTQRFANGFVSLCIGGSIQAEIYGDPRFVDALVAHLRARNVHPAS